MGKLENSYIANRKVKRYYHLAKVFNKASQKLISTGPNNSCTTETTSYTPEITVSRDSNTFETEKRERGEGRGK